MGITAENIAEQFSISREEQGRYSAESQNRAEAAIKGRQNLPYFFPHPLQV